MRAKADSLSSVIDALEKVLRRRRVLADLSHSQDEEMPTCWIFWAFFQSFKHGLYILGVVCSTPLQISLSLLLPPMTIFFPELVDMLSVYLQISNAQHCSSNLAPEALRKASLISIRLTGSMTNCLWMGPLAVSSSLDHDAGQPGLALITDTGLFEQATSQVS